MGPVVKMRTTLSMFVPEMKKQTWLLEGAVALACIDDVDALVESYVIAGFSFRPRPASEPREPPPPSRRGCS